MSFLVFAEVDRLIQSKIRKLDHGYGCTDCTFMSSGKYVLSNHIESRHVEYGGVMCDLCNKIVKTRQALRMHKSRDHRN